MFEKVNPSHPDKVADRIAGALVDYAYSVNENPTIAVEVLIGHEVCHIISESSVYFYNNTVNSIVKRICPEVKKIDFANVPQDTYLRGNQMEQIRCGDNGIFKGVPVSEEEKELTRVAKEIYSKYPHDGKYIISGGNLIICQSHAKAEELKKSYPNAIINPLGDWTGGINVDTGATNRKLGSDMAQSVTGGGLHGKDLSKADVSVNIYCWLKAQQIGKPVEMHCAIGDEYVDGVPYSEIVEVARKFIKEKGGFEKFSEWGLLG